jgi:predicted transcriptional regulator
MRKDCEMSIRVTKELKAQLESVAAKRGESSAVIVREALREYLERNGVIRQRRHLSSGKRAQVSTKRGCRRVS